MKYSTLFQTHQEYESFASGETMVKPNVSYCINEDETHYIHRDFVNEYFSTIARENGTISFNIWKSMGTDMITSMSYSTDNGETWNITNNVDNKTENLVIDVNVSGGDKVLWKGSALQLGYYDEIDYYDYVGSFFSSDCEFDTQGNIMSLLYGDNFKGQIIIENNQAFNFLFCDYSEQKTCEIVNAKNLSLPATTLANYCYANMFSNCTSLTTPPKLPATTLANNCYEYMFNGCTNLSTAPELPATTLAKYCYNHMFDGCISLTTAPELPATSLAEYCYYGLFYGCTSLTTAPELPATTLAKYCYYYMFANTNVLPDTSNIDFTSIQVVASCGLCGLFAKTKITDNDLIIILPKNHENKYCLPVTTLTSDCYSKMFADCTNLTTAPELPATTLANSCYLYMFSGCTSLTSAPELPATTLAQSCYQSMFYNCTSLVNAPELPATTLTNSCYNSMFYGCTSLTTAPMLPATTLIRSCYSNMFFGCTSLTVAPELPATTLQIGCYSNMFQNCTNLNYIKAMFTTTPSNTYTSSWVNGVAASGTFVKNSSATWNVTGNNGIPTGWTVQTASE